MKTKFTMIKYGVMITIFLTFFSYFFFSNNYYIPSQMTIHTHAPEAATAKLYWDTGAGFNERESAEFIPYEVKKFENKLHLIEITRLDVANPQSLANEVLVENIYFDGDNVFDLNSAVYQGKSFIKDNKYLALKESGTTIQIEAKFEKLDIDFLNHQWAGKVQVLVDGKPHTHDLFSPNTLTKKVSFDDGALPGTVENKFDLPQLDIKALKLMFNNNVIVEDISVKSGNGTVELSLPESSDNGTVFLINFVDLMTRSFHIFLFIVQLFTAAGITTVLAYLGAYLWNIKQKNLKSTLSYLFIREQRWFFWVLFLTSITVFSLWILGQWPGIMTVDSYYYTWGEIKTFKFQNVTPWIYNLYVLALTQFYDSPTVVGLFQIIVTSSLGSLILYYCYKKGASKWIVIVSGALFVTSIPIGIYNITVWKDIPFNTLMLFWGFFIFHLYFKRKYEGNQVNLNVIQLVLLSISFYMVCMLRQNGIVLVVAIPAILFIFKLISRKNFWHFAIAACSIFVLSWIVTPMISLNTSSEVSTFFAKTYKVAPLAAIFTSPNYYSPTPADDQVLFHKWMSDDEFGKYYTPVAQADKVMYMVNKWAEMNLQDQDKLKRLYFVRSLQNPHIFLTDRLSMMLGAMGLSSNVFITTNALRDAETDKSTWRPIEAYKFTSDTKVKWLEKIENKIITASTWFTGEIPIPFLIFNTLPAFLLLIVVICL